MNRQVTVTNTEPMRLYSNLKFEEKGVTILKPNNTVILEETGKIHTDENGKDYNVLRIRKNTRNYYVLTEIFK
jgi:hypothetical protein